MSYHEPVELLDEKTRNISRAITSLKEELEAIDWYNQRVAACQDPHLRAVLAHNRDEEIEHATMILEWLRRNMDGWNEQFRTYLFTEGDLTQLENTAEEGGASLSNGSLGIGNLE